MTSGKDIRDQQSEYRQGIEDRFLADGLANSDVVAAARRDAVAQVRQDQENDYERAVDAALEQMASTGANEPTMEE